MNLPPQLIRVSCFFSAFALHHFGCVCVAVRPESVSTIKHKQLSHAETASRHDDQVTDIVSIVDEFDAGRKFTKATRIVGGDKAEEGRYPYAVSIQMNNVHYCGGSLLADDVVLTAAHCSIRNRDTVLIGTQDVVNGIGGDRVGIKKVVIHPEFDESGTWEYDFAILILSRPTTASAAQIMELNKDKDFPPAGTSSLTMGWGDMNKRRDSYFGSDVLRIIESDVISNDACSDAEGVFDGYSGSYENLIFSSMICTLSKKQNACKGDSGGPLVVTGNNSTTDIQIGVISWSLPAGCATRVFPVVYSRISSGFDWIKEETCTKSTVPPDSLCKSLDPTIKLTTAKPTEKPSISPTIDVRKMSTLTPIFFPFNEPMVLPSSQPTVQPTETPSTPTQASSILSANLPNSLLPSISPSDASSTYLKSSQAPSTASPYSISDSTASPVHQKNSKQSLLSHSSSPLSSSHRRTSDPTVSSMHQPTPRPSLLVSLTTSFSILLTPVPTKVTSHHNLSNPSVKLGKNVTKPITSISMELAVHDDYKSSSSSSVQLETNASRMNPFLSSKAILRGCVLIWFLM